MQGVGCEEKDSHSLDYNRINFAVKCGKYCISKEEIGDLSGKSNKEVYLVIVNLLIEAINPEKRDLSSRLFSMFSTGYIGKQIVFLNYLRGEINNQDVFNITFAITKAMQQLVDEEGGNASVLDKIFNFQMPGNAANFMLRVFIKFDEEMKVNNLIGLINIIKDSYKPDHDKSLYTLQDIDLQGMATALGARMKDDWGDTILGSSHASNFLTDIQGHIKTNWNAESKAACNHLLKDHYEAMQRIKHKYRIGVFSDSRPDVDYEIMDKLFQIGFIRLLVDAIFTSKEQSQNFIDAIRKHIADTKEYLAKSTGGEQRSYAHAFGPVSKKRQQIEDAIRHVSDSGKL